MCRKLHRGRVDRIETGQLMISSGIVLRIHSTQNATELPPRD